MGMYHNMDESGEYYAKESYPDKETPCFYSHVGMWKVKLIESE